MSGYCDVAPGDPWHGPYHENEHGFPAGDEAVLLERLAMEIMQAGLSWLTVLKKREAMRKAFAGFAVDRVAAFAEPDRARLLTDPGIVRNRLKVEAIVHNAGVIRELRASHGGFDAWLAAHHPLTKPEWVKLFKRTFRFTGGEITGEFLMSTGWLPGAHRADCPVQVRIDALAPPWRQAPHGFYG